MWKLGSGIKQDTSIYQYFSTENFSLFKRRKFVLNEAKNSSIKYYGSLPFYYESMMEVCPSLIMICTRTWICHIRRVSIVFILLSKLQNQNNQFGRFFKIEIPNSYHKFRIVIFCFNFDYFSDISRLNKVKCFYKFGKI